jgi:hypothetical protein
MKNMKICRCCWNMLSYYNYNNNNNNDNCIIYINNNKDNDNMQFQNSNSQALRKYILIDSAQQQFSRQIITDRYADW